MKANDFLEYWNSTHDSTPTIQDALDWADLKHSDTMKNFDIKWAMSLAMQKDCLISKACSLISSLIKQGHSPFNNNINFVDRFRKMMED